jgi:hypothetical protein
MQLERLWPLLTRFWRDRMALDRSLMLAMLALRARIAYVIDNITYYMQVGTCTQDAPHSFLNRFRVMCSLTDAHTIRASCMRVTLCTRWMSSTHGSPHYRYVHG